MEKENIDLALVLKGDIDTYITWVLNNKAQTRDDKKKIAFSLLRNKEKTISNYREVIDTVFHKIKYWKEPTVNEKENFPEWRKQSYEDEITLWNDIIEGNPNPVSTIKEKETKRVCDLINGYYLSILNDMFIRTLTQDFYRLAELAGKIDFLKYLHTEQDNKAVRENSKRLTIPEIALMQYFLFKYEGGKEIVKGNAMEFSKGAGYKSTNKLINSFASFKDENHRVSSFTSKSGRADTKLLNEQIKRYENILPYLKEKYATAYSKAEKEYNYLKRM